MSQFINGTKVLRPLMTEIVNYGELFSISKELCEQFYWYYEAVEWQLPNGGIVQNWEAKLRQWAGQNRIYDRKAKERDEAKAMAQKTQATDWHDYQWYMEQVQISPRRARTIINERRADGKVYFRYPKAEVQS